MMKGLITRFIHLFTVYPLFAQENDQLSTISPDSIWYTEDIIVTATRTEELEWNGIVETLHATSLQLISLFSI